jgi:nucleotide-binding universal stress UspA family protein
MGRDMTGTVVVGYDRSPPSEQALTQAAREAERRAAELVVFHGYHFGRPASPMFLPSPALQRMYQDRALGVSEEGVRHVREKFPRLAVRDGAEAGFTARTLADAAAGVDLVVVGSRGRGGFAGQLLGSVSLRTLSDARCPVMVVRGEGNRHHGRVLAGIDLDDEGCGGVLDFAFGEARLRDVPLTVVHVWSQEQKPWLLNVALDGSVLSDARFREAFSGYDARMKALMRSAGERHRGVSASWRIAAGSPAGILVDESGHADLVVVGAHWRDDEHRGARIGPVAGALARHAHCPVVVVPHG